jgi:hypothetical protein
MKRTDHYHRIHSRYQVKCANGEDGKPRSTFDITVEGNTATIIKKDDIITVEREKLLPNKVKLLFILVFVTLNLIVFSTHSSAEIKSGFYSNKEYGFSISFPSGYTITELSKPEAVVWASNEAGCSITIQVLQLPEKIKNITLDNLSKNNLQSVLNETCQTSFSGMLDGALENCNIISIGGKKAIRFSGSYTDPNLSSSISHKRRQLEASMIFYKGKSYQILCSAPENKFSQHKKAFEISVNTFKFSTQNSTLADEQSKNEVAKTEQKKSGVSANDTEETSKYLIVEGQKHLESKDLNKARETFNKAIQLNPRNAEAYRFRGATYMISGMHDKAMSDFDKSIQLNPKDPRAYDNRGNITDGQDL